MATFDLPSNAIALQQAVQRHLSDGVVCPGRPCPALPRSELSPRPPPFSQPVRFNIVFLYGLLFAIFGCALSACSSKESDANEGKGKSANPPIPVVLAMAAQKAMPVHIQAIGNVEAYTTVAVKALVDGQIIRVHFKDGQEVKQGDRLFDIDPRPYEAKLKEAEAKLAGDRAQLNNSRAKERRYKELLEKRFVSGEFYAQIRADLDTSEAGVLADEAAVENARLQMQYCAIRSPVDGVAGKILIQQGNLVKANDTNPLVVINQVRPIYVNFAVPEQTLPAVRAMMAQSTLKVEAIVIDVNASPIEGELSFIDNSVDASTGTIKLKATFHNSDKILWPGQFVTAIVTLREQPAAIVVPSQAVQTGPKGPYVYVVKPDMTAELRDVVVERVEGSETVVAKGVSPGERVIVEGQIRIVPGAKVSPKSEATRS